MYRYNQYINLSSLLYSLALHNLKEHSLYFTANCPSGKHRDKNPSWVIYKNTGIHKCFSCGFQGNIEHLIQYLTGKSILEYLNIPEQESFLFKKILETALSSTFPRVIPEELKIKGIFKSVYDHPQAIKYLYSRGATEQFIQNFNIQYADYVYINDTLYNNRIVIPIYQKNKLINVEGRALSKLNIPKVLYCKGGSSDTLFNIDNLDFSKPLYLVEGIMDIVKIYE